METYQRFAYVYDCFMAHAPYAAWAAYIDRTLQKNMRTEDARAPIVLDMACGTGEMTVRMAQKGYDMIGADISADMLSVARDKADQKKQRILFVCQDMRRLDLFGTVDAVLCVCDGLNYLLSEADLARAFENVRRFINPGGVFIFDMNTEYKFKEVLAGRTFTEDAGSASYLWKNSYDPASRINTYKVDIFVKATANGEHFTETHRQCAYPVDTVCELLARAGMRVLQVNNAYTETPAGPDNERVSFVAVPDAAFG